MVKSIFLNYFRLTGAWSPLMSRLPLWQQQSQRTWTDGISRVNLSRRFSHKSEFGFTIVGRKQWLRVSTMLGKSRGVFTNSAETETQVITPSGILLKLKLAEQSPVSAKEKPILIMNHVAMNVTHLRAERHWYEKFLGPCVVLARPAAWEPVSRRFVHDVHLFRRPCFYIALRESKVSSRIDHIGWMAKSKRVVDQMAQLVSDLKWPIVFGPKGIDGSYLFHFIGPDEQIHDFFYPTDALPSPQ